MTAPATLPTWPHVFALDRISDPTGISDTGLVACGMIWPDGRVTMRWSAAGPPRGYHRRVCQVATYECVEDMMGVHGHGGATELLRLDPLMLPDELPLRTFALVHPQRGLWFWGVQWEPMPGEPVPAPAVTALQTGGDPCLSHWPGGVTPGVRATWGSIGLELLWLPEDLARLTRMLAATQPRRPAGQ